MLRVWERQLGLSAQWTVMRIPEASTLTGELQGLEGN